MIRPTRRLIPRPWFFNRGLGLLYDQERDVTWLQDVNYARTVGRTPDGQMDWDTAMSWVSSLTFRGVGGWRLPSALNHDGSGPCVGDDCTDSEFGHLFFRPATADGPNVTFLNFDLSAVYWTSTEASDIEAYAFELSPIKQGTLAKNPWSVELYVPIGTILAWPVHDGDVAATLWRRWLSLTYWIGRLSAIIPLQRYCSS